MTGRVYFGYAKKNGEKSYVGIYPTAEEARTGVRTYCDLKQDEKPGYVVEMDYEGEVLDFISL